MNALKRFCGNIGEIGVRHAQLVVASASRGDRLRRHLCDAAAALSPRRPGARPRAGGGGFRPARREAHRRQPAARHGRLAARQDALRSRRAEGDRRRPCASSRPSPASAMSGRWRRCAAGSPRPKRTRRRSSRNISTILPDYLTNRFIDEKDNSVVVTGRIPDIDVSDLLPVIEKLDGRPRRRAQGLSRLPHRGHRALGDRRAQQRDA